MKAFVVTQEWQTGDEHEHTIIGVFDSREKAVAKIRDLYNDDLEWMTQDLKFSFTELEENECNDGYSYIYCDGYFSENSIEEFDIQ